VSERVLITGAAGQIGTHLRRTFARADRTLRLMDRVAMSARDDNEAVEFATASFLDEAALDAAMRGVDAVITSGGSPPAATRGPTTSTPTSRAPGSSSKRRGARA